MRVALVQVASPADETAQERRERVAALVRQARSADLVVLPELWPTGYFAFEGYADGAEGLDGPTVAMGSELARELGAFIHLGSLVERTADGAVRNTAVMITPDGTVHHTYSKIHVFGYASREAELLQPGDSVGTAPTPFGTFGSTTCYDLRFPELWRALVDRGAEIVVVPAAWPLARLAHWRLFTTARSAEEQVFVIACNAVGEQAGTVLGGHSRIVDPWGEVLVEAGGEESITWCELDPARVGEVRHEFPVLRDRLASYDTLTGEPV